MHLKWSPKGHSPCNSWEFEYRHWRENIKHTIKRFACVYSDEPTD